jgi:hypothetical protein
VDPHGNIEDRRQALVRILAGLVAMAGLGGQFTFFPQEGALPQGLALAEKSKLSPALLPRALRNAVLRLLRPAESATRRLVVALAQNLAVTPARAATPKPLRRRRQFAPVMPPDPSAPKKPASLALPLLDPPRRLRGPAAPRRNSVPIISCGFERQAKIPLPPSPRDRLDATRLSLRLEALSKALADLPRQAQRFARWRARQHFLRAQGDRGRAACRRPLRFGPPPGSRRRGPLHEVQDILAFCHELALEALADTS